MRIRITPKLLRDIASALDVLKRVRKANETPDDVKRKLEQLK